MFQFNQSTQVGSVLLFAWLLACSLPSAAEEPLGLPRLRVDERGFNASARDIQAVCDSAAKELWPYFPKHTLEPIVVQHGTAGPITLFKRNAEKEIVVQLHTSDTYWSQYAYQYSHEFMHVLCGFREGDRSNQWFEETLCETASIFTLRAMARSWDKSPPYPHWRDYRDSLRSYTDDFILKQTFLREIHEIGLPAFYARYEKRLREVSTDRVLNGAMAVILLHYLEEKPQRWEAVRWLNADPSPQGESFRDHLRRWYLATPESQRETVSLLAELYGMKLSPSAESDR